MMIEVFEEATLFTIKEKMQVWLNSQYKDKTHITHMETGYHPITGWVYVIILYYKD